MARFRLHRLAFGTLGAIVLNGVVTVACGEPRGSLLLAVTTDMKAPKDVSVISLTIKTNGAVRHNFLGRVTPDGEVSFPATLAVVEPDDPNATIRVRVVAFQERKARVLRDVRTTVPKNGRTALLRLPLSFVNDGSAKDSLLPAEYVPPSRNGTTGGGLPEGEFDAYSTILSACDVDQTMIDGACVDDYIDSATLPDFDPSDVSGADDPSTCFDVKTAFASPTTLASPAFDRAACTLDLAGRDPARLNLAVGTPDTGECIGTRCYVPLDQGPGGWAVTGARIQIAKGVCRQLEKNGYTLHESRGLAPKQERNAVCQVPGANAPDSAFADGSSSGSNDSGRGEDAASASDASPDALLDGGAGDASGPSESGAPSDGGTPSDGAAADDGAAAANDGAAANDSGAKDASADADASPPAAPSKLFDEGYPTSIAVAGTTLYAMSANRLATVPLDTPPFIGSGYSPVSPNPGKKPWRLVVSSANGGGVMLTDGSDIGYISGFGTSPWRLATLDAPGPLPGVGSDVATFDGLTLFWATVGAGAGVFATPSTTAAAAYLNPPGPFAATAIAAVGATSFVTGDQVGNVARCTGLAGPCEAPVVVSAGSSIHRISGTAFPLHALATDGLYRIDDGATLTVTLVRAAPAGLFLDAPYVYARELAVSSLCAYFTTTAGVEWARLDGTAGGALTDTPAGVPKLGVAVGNQPGAALPAVYYSVFDALGVGGGVYWVSPPAACVP